MKNNHFIQLETSRLIIRDHKESDLKTHYTLMSDNTVMFYLKDIQTTSLKEAEENLKLAMQAIYQEKRVFYFLRMEEKSAGAHIGEIGYTVTDFLPEGKAIDIGYFTYAKFWGHGYVTEGLKEILRFAFEEDNVFYANCGCNMDNAGSERVMQKVNMKKMNENPRHEWYDNRWHGRVCYQLTKPQWEEMKTISR